MNRFLWATTRLMQQHEVPCTYVKFSGDTYNIATASTVRTSSQIQIKAYPKQMQGIMKDSPDIIWKETIMFYIQAKYITPKTQDKILYNGKTYVIDSYQEHGANGDIILYRVITTRVK